MSWLDDIVSSTVEAESPERFQYWTAMASISAIVKKNVFLDRFFYKLYPNIYVLIVGRSGLRKGNPVSLSKRLVSIANNTRIVAGRASIQAIIEEFGKAYTLEGGGMIKDAAGYIVSGEADALFVKDPQAMTILTDLYDTNAHEPEWKNSLKSGKSTLKNPCITFLGATNEEHFKSAIAEKDVKGGFVARTLIVFEDKRRTINSLMYPPKRTPDHQELTKYLKKISEAKGEFKITDPGKKLFDDWYKNISVEEIDDPTGTVERLGDTVLKVGMLISLAHSVDLVMTEEHITQSVKKCSECLSGVRHVTMGTGISDIASQTGEVLKYLIYRPEHKATRRQILAKFWGDIDAITLDRVVETLEQAGAIKIYSPGKNCFYVAEQSTVDTYKRFKAEEPN